MDKFKAIKLENELKGKTVKDYKILELINNGKSAAVFKAKKGNDSFALKIFDNELIENFGHEIQSKRIEQEISLKNHTIKNLIKIYDGGNITIDTQKVYFIVMELINGINLKDYIQRNTYGQDFIIKVLKNLYKTTEELLTQKQIVHRDIKPENIMVANDDNIILMDMGVLKLVGAKSFSDVEEKQFVGTLRYAPPEFLLREEEDSVNCWRAINIYQIGATLHDLIMKKELFNNKIPFANLVIAIKEASPEISNASLTFELVQLSRDMLSKNWKKRLELVPYERLENEFNIKNKSNNNFEQILENIKKNNVLPNKARFDEIEIIRSTHKEIREKQEKFGINLSNEIYKCFEKIKNNGICKSFNKSNNFSLFKNETYMGNNLKIQNFIYEIIGDLNIGYTRKLYIFVKIFNDENNYSEIYLFGILPSSTFFNDILNNQLLFINLINTHLFNSYNLETKFINIFKGNAVLDESFNNEISIQILKLVQKALKLLENEVQEEFKWQESMAKNRNQFQVRVENFYKKIIIIDSL